MKKDRKPRADSKLKNLPPAEQEGLWELMHPSAPDTRAWSLDEVGADIASRLGFSVALSTLSEWHSWYSLERRMRSARERANQTALQLATNKDFTPEAIDRAAQTVFTSEMLEEGNVTGYVALARLGLERAVLKQNEAKLQQNEARLEISRKALGHDARRLALLEKKAAQADQASAITNNDALTEEDKAARIRQLFRMG